MILHRRLLFAYGSLFLVLGSISALSAQQLTSGPPPAASEAKIKDQGLTRTGARRTAVVTAIERVRGAVVNIHSERTERSVGSGDPYGLNPAPRPVNGMGTGIIVDPRGYIVTNHHVIEDVSLLRIRLADGTTQIASVVARHPELDLALLRIDVQQPLPVMPIGTAADLMVGETVIAIGNAYGYEHTVSVGVVSAVQRDVILNKDMSYKALIQTDASINPGNSGGPLINIHGELVGVNVAIRAGAQGIGFAIPSDHMVRSVAQMLRSRRRGQPHDGLVVRDRLDSTADGLARSVIADRIDGPAALAGLKTGDVILQIGDIKVNSSIDVERALLDRKSGDNLPVFVRRLGQEKRFELVLNGSDRMVHPAANVDLVWTKLGLQLVPTAADEVTRVNRQLHGGLEVIHVHDEGVAAKAGIKKGDILVGLHQWETLTLDNVTYVLNHPERSTFNPLSFYILRSGQVRKGNLGTLP
jgi:serine protease Do